MSLRRGLAALLADTWPMVAERARPSQLPPDGDWNELARYGGQGLAKRAPVVSS